MVTGHVMCDMTRDVMRHGNVTGEGKFPVLFCVVIITNVLIMIDWQEGLMD